MRNLFEADAELKDWGIDTRLIGSYARLTARYPGKDVDVFLALHQLSVRHSPRRSTTLSSACSLDEYGVKGEVPGGRITPQARSLKIEFLEPEGHFSDDAFAIDAVPPCLEVSTGPSPTVTATNGTMTRAAGSGPIRVQFAKDTDAPATAAGVRRSAAITPHRHIRAAAPSGPPRSPRRAAPGGLFIEVAAYYVWNEQLVTGDHLRRAAGRHDGTRRREVDRLCRRRSGRPGARYAAETCSGSVAVEIGRADLRASGW